MKYKNQKEVIDAFFNGEKEGISGNLRIDEQNLVHYQTAIAEMLPDNTIVLNVTRYSIVTGRIQKQIQEKALSLNINILIAKGIEEGYRKSLFERVAK